MTRRFRTGGLAAWSIRRPVAVTMLALTVTVLGILSLQRLGVDLLPHIIYPEVRVRVNDPGVPAVIMEDRVTRQLEEQLAITEDAIAVESTTEEGRSAVNLSFPYGTDIDRALRDASNRLDRAKRFLPNTIEPPVIYKRDPAQIPVLEFVVSSPARSPTRLRDWVDYDFSRWFLNLPGVAALEVGGAPQREIHVLADQERLAATGLTFARLARALADENVDVPGGRLAVTGRELSSRTAGRFGDLAALEALPLVTSEDREPVRLGEVAQVLDTHADERLRIRLDGVPGVKLSVQKQPQANTVAVVDAVYARLAWLREQGLLPGDVTVTPTDDQARFIRHSVRNAALAATSGALLAMVVIYVFLGNLRRTLVIGTAIPLAILVTFTIMDAGGLTLNIMTLGGLALGVGLLVDNTIVMMENITRHQQQGEAAATAPVTAASEVTSAIVASTSTNLAAVLPFLFIGGLVGLLFSELIYTLSAAMLGSLLVALTLVPAYSARIANTAPSPLRRRVDALLERLARAYETLVRGLILPRPWRVVAVLLPVLALAVAGLLAQRATFLPAVDDGRIYFSVNADPGIQVDRLDAIIRRVEAHLRAQPEVESVFTMSGGFVFGRTERFDSNYGSLRVQLVPAGQRALSSDQWRRRMLKELRALNLAGARIRGWVRHVRGVHTGRGDDDLSLRIQGSDLAVLAELGDAVARRLADIPALSNIRHSYENNREELVIDVDRERAARLGLDVPAIGQAVRAALDGIVVSDYIEGDRQYAIRLRLRRDQMTSPAGLRDLLVGHHQGRPVRLREVAQVRVQPAPAEIRRDRQRRIVEISASISASEPLDAVQDQVEAALADLKLPEGYVLYDASGFHELQQGRTAGRIVLAVAVFLVLVVMAVQYESLRNPAIILLSIPFALIGVAAGLWLTGTPVSMPVWLGLIMLAGIVVNNAIVLVEQIEIHREGGAAVDEAVAVAARLRLRPILMTTFTTVLGMLPLSLGLGQGSELLQPLALVIVWGLSASLVVSLGLVPALYRLFHARAGRQAQAA